MKSFRNALLVGAVASAALLGWGCRGGGESGSRNQDQTSPQGTGGAGTYGSEEKGSSGDMGTQGREGVGQPDTIQPGTDQSGSQGTEPDTRR